MPRSVLAILVFAALTFLGTAAAFRIDQPARDLVVKQQGKNWKDSGAYRFNGFIRKVGDWPPLMAAAAVALAVARFAKSRRGIRIIAAAMIASTLAGVIANSMRLTTGRTRPRESPKIEQGFYGLRHEGKWLVGNSAYNSFPSGHTATAFGFAFAVLLASPLWGIFVTCAAGLVAWASILIGAHHPSDVIFSMFISAGVAWLVLRWVQGPLGPRIERWLRMPQQ